MKFTTKLFSLMLICPFAFGFSSTSISIMPDDAAIYEYKESINSQYDTNQSKVRFEGISTVSNESETEIAAALNDQNASTKLIIYLDNTFEDSLKRPTDDISLAEAKAILRKQRSNVKEYYTRKNYEYLQKLGLENLDVNYTVDEYAPFIVAEFNSKVTNEDIEYIYELSEQDSIKTIYVKSDAQTEEELTTAISAVGATNIVKSPSTNGDGIVIGILDTGIVDVNNANFKNVDVTVRDVWYYSETVSEHATMVASVALGMAPAASILSVELYGTPNSEIGWLLDNEVNVVNMSFGYTDSDDFGNYTSESAYVDSIARDNWVTFVGSAETEAKAMLMSLHLMAIIC